jgi:leucyl-tRNA synthetase
MAYNPSSIESKWQANWEKDEVYKIKIDKSKPKYYALDMFPYPSGAGLHVGHPLGYIASDIFSRYKRLKGFNVLHPMGFDAFGLPAEQYAIQVGKHPAEITDQNVITYKNQLQNLALSFDWSRAVKTSDPKYYKWTQWIFIELFNHTYCTADDKAQSIELLIAQFEKEGNLKTSAFTDYTETFTANDWKSFNEKEKADILMHYRLAYKKESFVNWCEELGTVLANDEIVNGVSERGGFPVIQKPMLQWSLRITAYAQRLLEGLDKLDWPSSLIAQQQNWIGRSQGAQVFFDIKDNTNKLEVFTTRPDTIFGVSFMVIAPEHDFVNELTTEENKVAVAAYVKKAGSKSAIERQAEKEVSGVFTGSYAIHPFTGKEIPIYISEYVLVDYGTGAIMAVPSDDERDEAFATKFDIEIFEIYDKERIDENGKALNPIAIGSDFLNGLESKEAIALMIDHLEEMNIGTGQINYRLRDANFSRQRYWGEPFPIYYENGIAKALPFSELPLELPEMDDIRPQNGQAPLSKAKDWNYKGFPLETDTMPGNAGSSWYFLRYMDADNDNEFVGAEALAYWNDIDFYCGGAEHAVGHLLYARFWHKFLFDLRKVPTQEPFKKLFNQGMIQGRSNFVYRINGTNTFVSKGLKKGKKVDKLHVDVNIVENDILDIEAFKNWLPEYKEADFELEDGKYICGFEVEKMSKSKYNVINPDDVIAKYGTDTFRMFEMFLGPIEASKPWNTQGIDGVSKFLRKFWNLFFDAEDNLILTDDKPTEAELKTLHTCIKKVNEDIEKYSFNTCVSAFMIATNELTAAKCHKNDILVALVKLISPFAPHIAEELWSKLGNETSIVKDIDYPKFDEKYLVKSTVLYPVSINGKMRVKIELPAGISQDNAKAEVLANEVVQKWVVDKPLRKFIFVPGRIVNIVC